MGRKEAYSLIDQFLRGNLSDDDYAQYSQALKILVSSSEETSIYRKGLEDICRHLEISAGSMATQSAVWMIATKALACKNPSTKVEG